MKSIALVDSKMPATQHLWLDQLAKNLVLKSLEGISQGTLILEDGDRHCSFGAPLDSSPLIATIRVHSDTFYRQVAFGGSVGAGESYIDRHWTSPDLVEVVRLFSKNITLLNELDSRFTTILRFAYKLNHKLRPNSQDNARANIGAHYNLSNDFFQTFLDSSMLYSAAIFKSPNDDLAQASRHKMERVCEKLQLNSSDHLLEIGTGWGGMAIYAAQTRGCRVTTITLSEEQHKYASAWIKREGLSDRIDVQLKDYRALDGQFDKIVSIEMIEAVGHEYYANYFELCSRLLKPTGLFLIQAITVPDQRYEYSLKNSDFIQQYIFPGGCLPSIGVIAQKLAAHTDLSWADLYDMTEDYALTLAAWRANFLRQIEQVQQLGFSSPFLRMWEFYLCYCEGGFKERAINTYQMLFTKPHAQLAH